MAKRTNAQIFLDRLTDLSGDEQKPIGNGKLRSELGWVEDKYWRVRQALMNQALIAPRKGQGGSVVPLKSASKKTGLKVFISYSHLDEGFKNDLVKHLEPLKKMNIIEAWHDRKLKAGDEWEKAISKNLKDADLILLLVSIDFINSAYCYDVEMEEAMEHHDDGESIVIPIILRSCLWGQTPFAKLQALPKDAKPIALWPDRDDAMMTVAREIRGIATERLSQR